jgi:hypothetical protein
MRASTRLFAYLVLTHSSAAFSQPAPSRPPPDLTGVWQSDFGTAEGQRRSREYLRQGRELQLKWCGFAWPEAEIDRRLAVISKGFMKLEISKTAGGKGFLRRATTENGDVSTQCSLSVRQRRMQCSSASCYARPVTRPAELETFIFVSTVSACTSSLLFAGARCSVRTKTRRQTKRATCPPPT